MENQKTCKECVYQGTNYCQFKQRFKELMEVYPDIEIAPCSSFKPRERKRMNEFEEWKKGIDVRRCCNGHKKGG